MNTPTDTPTVTSKRDYGWDPDGYENPICDACVAMCDRGCRITQRGQTITRVICFDCAEREDLDRYRTTRRLFGRFTLTATLRRNDPAYAEPVDDIAEVNAAIKAFATLVWPAVSAMIDAEKLRAGMSAERDGLKIRSFVSAGRVLLHVERGDSYCCAIGEEGNPARGLGLQGIDATAKEACELWHDATKFFMNGGTLTADQTVGIG